jgi:hypothetical protein
MRNDSGVNGGNGANGNGADGGQRDHTEKQSNGDEQ